MTFNTGNPVGSTDARDLYDNAQNFDKFSLGQELEYPDRLGVPRKSLAGIRAEVTETLSRLGYQVLGDYAPDLVVQNYGQVFRKDGEFYRAKAETTLPYPLNGDWAVDAPKFVSVGDAALRLDLAGDLQRGDGARRVNGAAIYVATLADLRGLSGASGGELVVVSAKSNGGLFAWDESDISAQVSQDPAQGLYVAPTTSASGANGAWVRIYSGAYDAGWTGANLDNLPSQVAGEVFLRSENYTGSSAVVNREDLRFVSSSASKVNGLPMFPVRFSGAIKPPAGFPWQPPLFITEKAGVYSANFDIVSYDRASREPTAVHYYVNVTGSNSSANDGLSPETAYRSVYWAIRQARLAGVTNLILHVARGVYNRHDGWNGERFIGNISVFCEEGTYLTAAERQSDLSWSNLGGDVYSVVRSGISRYRGIVDMNYRDAFGKPFMYQPTESVGAVTGNPGRYYVDAATNTVYVCMRGSRVPDENLLVLSSSSTGNGRQADGAGYLYVKNARFIGGGGGAFFTGSGTGAVACFDSCEFAFSSNNAGLRSMDTGLTISYNCDAYLNYSDGFNYHDYGPVGARAIEIDCRSWWNGLYRPSSEPENVNGSSAHESIEIVRVNTQAWNNLGPNIVDIQEVKCWNIGCKAWDSVATQSSQKVDFYFTDSNVTAWLDGCEGGLTGKQLATNTSSVAYVRNWGGGLSASGNIQTY